MRAWFVASLLCVAWTGLGWTGLAWADATAGTGAMTEEPKAFDAPLVRYFPGKPYARNIWVMRLYNGRLYIGSGNSSNDPPAANAGPVPVLSYDLKRGPDERHVESVLEEEQIDRIIPVGNTLCIPGHDPREDWSLGNIHCRENGGWVKHRTLPRVLHAYDLTEYKGALVAAVATKEGGGVAVSLDHGRSWSIKRIGYGRTYSLMKVGSRLFAVKSFQPARNLIKDPENNYAVAEVEAHWPMMPPLDLEQPVRGMSANDFDPLWQVIPRRELGRQDFFPDIDAKPSQSRKITRDLEVGPNAFYIGADKHNDHQSRPFGLFRAGLSNGKLAIVRVPLPDQAVPWDIVYRDGTLYVLTNTPVGGEYRIRVFGIAPPAGAPVPLADFRSGTFARSFEVDVKAGTTDFYFGLGCDTDSEAENPPLSPLCGHILKLSSSTGLDKH